MYLKELILHASDYTNDWYTIYKLFSSIHESHGVTEKGRKGSVEEERCPAIRERHSERIQTHLGSAFLSAVFMWLHGILGFSQPFCDSVYSCGTSCWPGSMSDLYFIIGSFCRFGFFFNQFPSVFFQALRMQPLSLARSIICDFCSGVTRFRLSS